MKRRELDLQDTRPERRAVDPRRRLSRASTFRKGHQSITFRPVQLILVDLTGDDLAMGGEELL